MMEATADLFSTTRIRRVHAGSFISSPENQVRTISGLELLPSRTIANVMAGPTPIAAAWLPVVQKRIVASVVPPNAEYVNDGRWLTQEIATQAFNFFQAASDVLPSEPYVYTSIEGDLIAEFKGSRGTMTNVIGKTSVIAFAVIDGNIINTSPQFLDGNISKLRHELQQLSEQLR